MVYRFLIFRIRLLNARRGKLDPLVDVPHGKGNSEHRQIDDCLDAFELQSFKEFAVATQEDRDGLVLFEDQVVLQGRDLRVGG